MNFTKNQEKKGTILWNLMKANSPSDYLSAFEQTIQNSQRLYSSSKQLFIDDYLSSYNLIFIAVEEALKALNISIMYNVSCRTQDNKVPVGIIKAFLYMFESHDEKIKKAQTLFISELETEIRKHELGGREMYLKSLDALKNGHNQLFKTKDYYKLKNQSLYVDVDRANGKFTFPSSSIKKKDVSDLFIVFEVIDKLNKKHLTQHSRKAAIR